MTASRRGAQLVLGVGVLGVFALGVLAGFVYGHEPAAAVTVLELQPAAGTPAEEVRGTVLVAGPDFLEVSTTEGVRRVSFTSATPVEELTPAREASAGAANIGGNHTESGFVLTGIVFLGEQ
ncbi:MAG: hypothetical protein IT299_11695 [Dehalococcoidia bacterium]|nr:hypothetical protein [Dehalococcoidia bacterium]